MHPTSSPTQAMLSLEVRLLCWKEADIWHGACIDLNASATGRSFNDLFGALLREATRAGERDLQAGRLPGRPLSHVPEDILARYRRLAAAGSKVPICDAEAKREVLIEPVTVTLSAEVPSMMEPPDLPSFRVLFLPEDGYWTAQCLEYDIGGEGATKEDAAMALFRSLFATVTMDRMLGQAPLSGVGQAPEEFFEKYERARRIEEELSGSPEWYDPEMRVIDAA